MLLAIIHVQAATNARESLLKTVNASDTYNYMEAKKIIRELLLKGLAQTPSLSAAAQAGMLKEAARLRSPDRAGHGIVQLQTKADLLRDEGERSARIWRMVRTGRDRDAGRNRALINRARCSFGCHCRRCCFIGRGRCGSRCINGDRPIGLVRRSSGLLNQEFTQLSYALVVMDQTSIGQNCKVGALAGAAERED